jgi:hypothetical protein
MPRPRQRVSDAEAMSDRHFRPANKKIIGKTLEGASSQMIKTVSPPDDIHDARVTVQRNMIDIADGKILTKMLGLDWATVGDGPTVPAGEAS